MDTSIIVGILSLIGTAIGTIGGIIASSKLTNYRIGELEKKVEKHNTLVERTYAVERDLKTAFRLIDEIKESLKETQHELKDDRDRD